MKHYYLLSCQRYASVLYHVSQRKLAASHLLPQSTPLFADRHQLLLLLLLLQQQLTPL
jgi:hypothetical protein